MKRIFAIALGTFMVFLCACSENKTPVEPSFDPHEGMVEVASGLGTLMWANLFEDMPVSDFAQKDFKAEGQTRFYNGDAYDASFGIDVSEHQGEIDWAQVASSGVDFAIIRAGYRGYTAGSLMEDAYFRSNIDGAIENGLDVGIYFFSQATSEEEAIEEAEYLLEIISGYDVTLSVYFDWENIGTEPARTDDVSSQLLTDCTIAFCDEVANAGYTPGIYTYRYLAYYTYELDRIADYTLWMGAIGDYPDFYYKHDTWQYSITGVIPGIDGDVDLNMNFTPRVAG